MPYPTDQDLQDYLYGAGLIASPPVGASSTWNYAGAAAAGRRRIEQATKRTFVQPAAFAREFDAPTNREKRIFVGDHTAVTSITYLSQAIAATDYLSGPLNARDAFPVALPYQYIEFFREWWAPTPWAQRAQLVVTATWGAFGDVPDDVFNAMLIAGGLALWPQIVTSKTRGFTSFTEAGVQQAWGATPFVSIKNDWEAELQRVCDEYRDWAGCIT